MISKSFAGSIVVAVAIAGIFLLILASGARAALPATGAGTLDRSFGLGGTGQTTFNFGSDWDSGTHVIVQPDGKYLVAGVGVTNISPGPQNLRSIGFLARYLPDGSPDTSFNGAGRRVLLDASTDMFVMHDVLLQPDGKIAAVGWSSVGGLVTRLNADGSTDYTFGNGGQLLISASASGLELSLSAIAMLPDGRLLIAGSEGPSDGWGGTLYSRPFTLRLLPNGQPELTYGPGGRVSHDSLADDLVPQRISMQASGKVTVIGGDLYSTKPAIAIRLNADGTSDTSFASAGKYVVGVADLPASELQGLLVEADGSLIMVGRAFRPNQFGASFAVRLTPSGQPDVAFGEAGVVALTDLTYAHGVTKQPNGKLVISGDRTADGSPQALVVRLTPTGELDQSFGIDGVTTLVGVSTNAAAVDDDGRIVVVGAVWPGPQTRDAQDFMLARLIGGEVALVEAVEYYHQQFEHYFVTAEAAEIQALDSGAIPGWWRTGQRYRVHYDAAADRAPVCRFHTAAFAGKASHFHTASAAECEYVKRLSEWTFEGVVFHAQLPSDTGNCAIGTAPVYRLYNNGRGDAPNHAYTPDAARRDRLMQAGWVAEGTAWCVVLASEDPAAQTSLFAHSTWELPLEPEIYGPGSIRTTFAAQLSTPGSVRWIYEQFDIADPPAAIHHEVNSAWTGSAHFEPLTGRFLVVGNSGFEGLHDIGVAWELDSANGPTSAVCAFGVRQNVDARYPNSGHPFQPVLWSGCMQGVANKQ